MDGISRWLVVTMSILILSNNCFARNFGFERKLPDTRFEVNNNATGRERSRGVTLSVTEDSVVMDNGIVRLTLGNPTGFVMGISYNGMDNLLEEGNDISNRGYFDVVWDAPGQCGNGSAHKDCTDEVHGTTFKVIRKALDRTEISFTVKWSNSSWDGSTYPNAPINVDRRYVLYQGLAGFYSYTILDREPGFPQANIHQIRAVYKLRADRFHYMAMADDRQRQMPSPEDRAKGEVLDYKEAVRLIDPENPDMKDEVDDKYQYSCEDRDNKVNGWIAHNPVVGFWLISPSNEYRSAGPFKQDLTSHVGPTCLQMFHSAHYAGGHIALAFKEGETWKKVFGPFLVYLNSNRRNSALWADAKLQRTKEARRWPYSFPLSNDFAKFGSRGSVSGQLFVSDRYHENPMAMARNAWVGLAAVGAAGSWQTETKGYQFWVKAKKDGCFFIHGALAGTYSLYATVPGFIGDYKYPTNIEITAGKLVQLHNITFEPPRNGPTLWEIGTPDRSAAEFFIPKPDPGFVNKVLVSKPRHKFRQYGLWKRYTELYPDNDLVYTIGQSEFKKHWFFAHVPRKVGDVYKATTWQIAFPLAQLEVSGNYTLRLAFAAASAGEVHVRINNPARAKPNFTTKLFGKDNAIARHGIRGLYRLYNVNVPSHLLRQGNNSVYLTQTRYRSPVDGVMYDYIRLEGPPMQI